MFDCGESTQHQLMHRNININRLKNIFITHLHGDHLFGLPGLLLSLSLVGNSEGMTLFAPAGLKKYIETCYLISQTFLNYPLYIIKIAEGTNFNNNLFTGEATILQYRIFCYGHCIDRDLPFQVEIILAGMLCQKMEEKMN